MKQQRPRLLILLLAASWACLTGDSPRALAADGTGASDFPSSGAPYLAAYRWGAANRKGGAAANEAFARWLNQPAVWAEDFEPAERWDSIAGGAWQLSEWSKWKTAVPGRRLILSVPLLPGPWDLTGPREGPHARQPVSLKVGAGGEYNAHFKALAQNLVRYGLGDSVLRLGWEFNGGWYAWRAGADPAAFAAYWREIVQTMRAVPGTEGLRFCWNPALGWQQFPAEKAWPGDDWVDIVGLDVYDDSWLKDTYPFPEGASRAAIEARRRAVWDKVLLHGDHGLTFWRDFAAAHKRPFAMPEWGVDRRKDGHGGLDNADFIEQMHSFVAAPANRVYFHCYFDVQAPDGGHQLSPGKDADEATEFPRAATRFRALFGRTLKER